MAYRKTFLSMLAVTAAMTGAASAVPIQVTVTNNQGDGGFAFTPVYFGFGDGSFDAFDVGSEASSGVELVAEVGVFNDPGDTVDPMTVQEERVAADPGSVGGVAAAPGGFVGAPVVEPGEVSTFVVDLDPTTQRFAQFISMLLPSNDTFFGNDDPVELFNNIGEFNGPVSFDIRASNLYDAGTEINDFTDGPAFVDGQSGGAGTTENGVITEGVTLASLNVTEDITLASGDLVELLIAQEFFSQNGSLATISFALADAEVPVPAAALLFAPVLAGLGLAKRPKA